MDKKIAKFLSSENISPNDILYIRHEDRKSVIYLHGGEKKETYIPVKYILASLPKGNFINITKGVVVARSAILSIDGAKYTMIDGREFVGRRRGAGEHKSNRMALNNVSLPDNRIMSENINDRFAVFDRLPLPACVVETVYSASGHSVDFIYRYCNDRLADMIGLGREEIVDKLNTALFESMPRQWVVNFSEVAISGNPKYIKVESRVYGGIEAGFCYCPAPGYCACIMIPRGIEEYINSEYDLEASIKIHKDPLR